MSGSSTNNFTPASRNWQGGRDYGAYVPSSSGWNDTGFMFARPRSVSFYAASNANRGAHYPWQSFEETMILEPLGFPEPHSPLPIRVTVNGIAREIIPRWSPISLGSPPRFLNQPSSPPRFTNQQNIQVASGDSRLTPDEQKTVLKKLKKEIYNPAPKKFIRGLSLYYRDNARNISTTNKQKEKDDDGSKSCAVCLEDFEPKENVMLTPCNHMFHEECIVPWIKSNGRCPVCRFDLCEGTRTNASLSANYFPNVQPNYQLARELVFAVLGNTTH